jgi:cyclase
MRNWLCLFVLLCIAGFVEAQDRDFSKVEIKVTHVAGTVYMLEGAGGNIAASVGKDGIVIVDDQYAPLAEKIRAALKSVADEPVRFVLNTHYHGDHTGGNAQFSTTSTIIAQENVRKRLQQDGFAGTGGAMKREVKASPPEALPIITFDEGLTVHLNGEDIRAMHYPSGHTDGDSMIYFEKSNVLHMGDDFVTYGFPFIDVLAGGSVEGMIVAVESAMKEVPDDVKIIPGHGTISSKKEVRDYLEMLKATTAVVKKALAENKTLEQMKQEKILDQWQKYSGDFINTDVFIETLYYSLTGKKGAHFIRHN